MKRTVLENFFSFLLVLVLTIGTVATLSMATSAKTETASDRYSQQVRESQSAKVTELSVAVPENEVSPTAGVLAFGVILAVPATVVLVFARSNGKGKSPKKAARRYTPRADMAFQNRV